MQDRGTAQALGGRARGIIVGALIAFGWAYYGASALGPGLRYPILAIAAALTAALLVAAVGMLRRSRAMPAPSATQAAAGKRAWRWFWLNLVGEIVLLNIAINLLAAPALRIYWIPAISAVVGLHFWPMAYFFRTRSYWFVGAAMMIGAALAAVIAARQADAAPLVGSVEALANAIILWSASGAGVLGARAASGSQRSAEAPYSLP